MSPAQLQQLLQRAVVHHRAGRLAEAAAAYAQARRAAPRNFDACHLGGLVALQQGRNPEAAELLATARRLDPRSPACAMRLGLALMALGRSVEALAHFLAAVELNPQYAEGWDNLAYCHKAADRLPEAIGCHERAVALNPRGAASWYNFGLTLSLAGRIGDALACHDRAIAADPGYGKAHFGRAQALQQSHRLAEAIAAYDVFLRHSPHHHEAQSYRLFALNYLDALTAEALFREHEAYGRRLGAAADPAPLRDPDPARRLRVAVLSPDLRAHSCAYFIEPLLRHLDPARFELYLYHDHFRTDAVSNRLRSLAAVWRNFVGQPTPAVEAAIRADVPDILIDLAGHTGLTNRLPLFARRPAPVQVSYLGYPNTTGVPAIGWRFTDAIADPPGASDALATEQLVRFAPTAWCYAPPDHAPAVSTQPVAETGRVTFGCFNNLAKISDTTLRLWAGVLAAVPGSRLLLKGRGLGEAAVRDRYLARCAAAGIDGGQLDFAERTARTEDHLALYGGVDIALDTFPYHGTTTTCEALWMGVPVVTLLGDRHAARVSASLLMAAGHPEWIATDAADYVRIAAALASEPVRLAALRASLRDELLASPLLDHAGQAARFGAALRDCWAAACAGASKPAAA
jgi:predicted O-linked N-acetylglucosamine transferase (SPINDLY family)